MPTRFGKFISGKHFSKLFLLFYILFMCFAAHETNESLCLLIKQPHIYGTVHILFAVIALLIMIKKRISGKWSNRIFKKILSFLSCFFIYYFTTLLLWELVCLISKPTDIVKAYGVVGAIFFAILIVLYGYLHAKVIKIKPYQITLETGKELYRVALISDIHLGVFVGEKHIQRMVNKINSLNSDISKA